MLSRGGSGTGAFAKLDPLTLDSNMNITAGGLLLEGGSGSGAYAAIVSAGGFNLILGSGGLTLAPGGGSGADAVVVLPNGAVTYSGTCVANCGPLSANPLANNITEGGIFNGLTIVSPTGTTASSASVREVFIEVIKLLLVPPSPPPIIDPIEPVDPLIEGDKNVC